MRLQSRFGDFHGGLPGGGAGEFDLAFVDAVTGRDVEGVLMEVAVVDATIGVGGLWEGELEAAELVEDLEASGSADEEVARGGGALAIEGVVTPGAGWLALEVRLAVSGGTFM